MDAGRLSLFYVTGRLVLSIKTSRSLVLQDQFVDELEIRTKKYSQT